jgi:hypothetical protein
MAIPTEALGLSGTSKIHNIWSPENSSAGPWKVPSHGVVLLRITK